MAVSVAYLAVLQLTFCYITIFFFPMPTLLIQPLDLTLPEPVMSSLAQAGLLDESSSAAGEDQRQEEGVASTESAAGGSKPEDSQLPFSDRFAFSTPLSDATLNEVLEASLAELSDLDQRELRQRILSSVQLTEGLMASIASSGGERSASGRVPPVPSQREGEDESGESDFEDEGDEEEEEGGDGAGQAPGGEATGSGQHKRPQPQQQQHTAQQQFSAARPTAFGKTGEAGLAESAADHAATAKDGEARRSRFGEDVSGVGQVSPRRGKRNSRARAVTSRLRSSLPLPLKPFMGASRSSAMSKPEDEEDDWEDVEEPEDEWEAASGLLYTVNQRNGQIRLNGVKAASGSSVGEASSPSSVSTGSVGSAADANGTTGGNSPQASSQQSNAAATGKGGSKAEGATGAAAGRPGKSNGHSTTVGVRLPYAGVRAFANGFGHGAGGDAAAGSTAGAGGGSGRMYELRLELSDLPQNLTLDEWSQALADDLCQVLRHYEGDNHVDSSSAS